jgi:hypothetical protein
MQETEEKKEIPPTDKATGIFEYPDEELKEIYSDHNEGS